MLKKLILTVTVIVLATLIYAANYLSAMLSAGSGFSAKNICSGHFISGMPGQLVVDQALVSAASVLSHVSFKIDENQQWVDTRIFGLAGRRAVFMDGTGCTLLSPGEDHLQRRLKKLPERKLDHQQAWPHGAPPAVNNGHLEALLERAFSEPDSQRLRNTKAVVVIHNGQLVAEKYAEGIDTNTALIGWSMSKSVTNLLIGILVGDGKLSLQQAAPVPVWHLNTDDPRSAISIDHLLRMSSGLEFGEHYALYSDVTRMLSVESDAAGFAASKPLFVEPDSLWAYSSGTSNILAGIIKQSVGGTFQDYYEFPQKRLFQPLGIRSASMETDHNGTFISSSYMYASARDWARLGQLCLQDGYWQGQPLLPEGWINYSTTATPNNPKNNFGAHFWLNAEPDDPSKQRVWPSLPADTYSMNGFQGQRVIIVPSKNLVVVRMGFSPGENRGIEELVSGLIGVLE
jgi:CubicO group peptidase (beta-lactamase class C family)